MKGANEYAQVCRILKAAFLANDFDGFELSFEVDWEKLPASTATRLRGKSGNSFHFEKPGRPTFKDGWPAWHLTLELVTTANQWRGSMRIYRFYTDRALLMDINLLTSVFPVILGDAIDRALVLEQGVTPEVTTTDADFLEAEAS